ncbi:hypothetical protein, partial [Weissella cibaria]|uniref:hypothetical protein n=1 Tax=Weissella cibaria TaxID=137591 RepID=UPI0019D5B7EE
VRASVQKTKVKTQEPKKAQESTRKHKKARKLDEYRRSSLDGENFTFLFMAFFPISKLTGD